MTELTRSTKAYSELTGRTEPMVTDVVVALIEMGKFDFIVQLLFNW